MARYKTMILQEYITQTTKLALKSPSEAISMTFQQGTISKTVKFFLDSTESTNKVLCCAFLVIHKLICKSKTNIASSFLQADIYI